MISDRVGRLQDGFDYVAFLWSKGEVGGGSIAPAAAATAADGDDDEDAVAVNVAANLANHTSLGAVGSTRAQ